MHQKITGLYCITLEDVRGTIYSTCNTNDPEDAMITASDFYARAQDYSETLQFRKCARVSIIKRNADGDYNSIAVFTR